MSRHGMIPPAGRPGRGEWSNRRAVLGFAAQALGREAIIGTALYACAGPSWVRTIGLSLAVLGVVILWSRWFSLLRPGSWRGAVAEGLLLYGGSVGVGNVLLITLGPCHWAPRP